MTLKRDWKTFFKYSWRSLRGSLIGVLLVPAFYLALNPRWDRDSVPGLLISLRIGFEVVVVNFLVSTAIYALIFQQSIPQMIRLKESFKFRFVVGFLGMALGLFVASILEPVLGNREMNFQGITVGLTIGSLTLLVFLLKSAYAQTQTYNLKLKAESAESTLNVLKNQIQPHFLFNSLNSLAELIDSDRESASQMTQKLSDLYREILESSKLQVSSLQSEISIVQKYLELESLRFGDRLKYQIETPEKMDDIFIPSLLLQTLIENAIKHGISQNLEGGIVSLKINADQNGFLVRIENTCAKKILSGSSSGTGLSNTKARLDLLYGDKHNFEMSTRENRTIINFWFSGVVSV